MSNNILFSIVTPSCNSEDFIAETIESVISQSGDFSIEYIIIDNCSTDGTVEIIRRYQKDLKSGLRPLNCNSVTMHYISENDSGMYEAINKGFNLATGDIYAWINADDLYLNGCFNLIGKVFNTYADIRWVKGITSFINEDSTIYKAGKCYLYAREWIEVGLYGPVLYFIQQDSVFWRKDLWQKSGGVKSSLRLAGDYDLWKRFARIEPLYSVNAFVSCFRKTCNQKSENIDEYWNEIENVSEIKYTYRKADKILKKYEMNSDSVFWKYKFKSVFCHLYHLINVNGDGEINIYDGAYQNLQEYL